MSQLAGLVDVAPGVVVPRVRTAPVPLEGDYAGIVVTMRTNPTIAQRRALRSGDEAAALAAWADLIEAWNVAGPDGAVLPCTAAALEDLPDDLVGALIAGWAAEVNRPLAAKNGSSTT